MHCIYDCQHIISNFFKKTGNNFYPLFRNNPSIISNYTLNDLKNGVIPNEHWEMLARKDVFEEYKYTALLDGYCIYIYIQLIFLRFSRKVKRYKFSIKLIDKDNCRGYNTSTTTLTR